VVHFLLSRSVALLLDVVGYLVEDLCTPPWLINTGLREA
jgi:hypothetical protein